MRLPTVLRGYLLIGSILLIGVVFLYTNNLIERLNAQADFFSALLARFLATAAIPATQNDQVAEVVRQMTDQLEFPVVVTDAAGRPIGWTTHGTGIHPDSVTVEQQMNMDPAHPPPGPLTRLVTITRMMDRRHAPIPMQNPQTGSIEGYVHYGESGVIGELRWYPIAEIVAMFIFGLVGYWGFLTMKRSEQRSIWVGMAMETAHQLGTPVSSLLGWTELLRDRLGLAADAPLPPPIALPERATDPPDAAETPADVVEMERALADEILYEMERDLERVQKVANRFGHIGSVPHLVDDDIVPLVHETVEYVRRRLPRLGLDVELRAEYQPVPPVSVNRELFSWAMENLLKNALDAIDDERHLVIDVSVSKRPESETVEVVVQDTGRGMTVAEQHRAFSPGYTTKSAGWGLGLTLVQRIVEEYHGGRVWIRESAPGVGTTFVMSFPV